MNIVTNEIVHQDGLPWAKDDAEFMAALRYAMTQTTFIIAAHGLTAERIHTLHAVIQHARELQEPKEANP